MRLRAATIIWIPFVFSVGTISWALLLAGLAVMAAVVLTPAMRDLKDAETARNDYRATLELLDQQIAMQKEFAEAATKDPLLMERLASRQLNLNRPDQDILVLGNGTPGGGGGGDRSIRTLLAESLRPVKPAPVKPVNPLLAMAMNPGLRPMLIMLACGAIALSFFLGVRYERS